MCVWAYQKKLKFIVVEVSVKFNLFLSVTQYNFLFIFLFCSALSTFSTDRNPIDPWMDLEGSRKMYPSLFYMKINHEKCLSM